MVFEEEEDFYDEVTQPLAGPSTGRNAAITSANPPVASTSTGWAVETSMPKPRLVLEEEEGFSEEEQDIPMDLDETDFIGNSIPLRPRHA